MQRSSRPGFGWHTESRDGFSQGLSTHGGMMDQARGRCTERTSRASVALTLSWHAAQVCGHERSRQSRMNAWLCLDGRHGHENADEQGHSARRCCACTSGHRRTGRWLQAVHSNSQRGASEEVLRQLIQGRARRAPTRSSRSAPRDKRSSPAGDEGGVARARQLRWQQQREAAPLMGAPSTLKCTRRTN